MNPREDYDFLFKTVIVGDSAVGKTQMLTRFVDNEFSSNSKPTIGVEFGTKTIAVGKHLVKNQIWDTAGQDKYRALTCSYYRGAVGAIVVFDLSRAITFEHVQIWIDEVRQNCQMDVSILLVGNKSDIPQQQVREEQIENYALENKLMYIPTSALSGENIEFAFHELMKEIIKRQTKQDPKPMPKKKDEVKNQVTSEIDIPIPTIENQELPNEFWQNSKQESTKGKDKKSDKDNGKIQISNKEGQKDNNGTKPRKKCC